MGDGIAQRQRLRFSLSSPGFESRHSINFMGKINFQISDLSEDKVLRIQSTALEQQIVELRAQLEQLSSFISTPASLQRLVVKKTLYLISVRLLYYSKFEFKFSKLCNKNSKERSRRNLQSFKNHATSNRGSNFSDPTQAEPNQA